MCNVQNWKFSSIDSIYGKMLIIIEHNSEMVTVEVYGQEFQRENVKLVLLKNINSISFKTWALKFLNSLLVSSKRDNLWLYIIDVVYVSEFHSM